MDEYHIVGWARFLPEMDEDGATLKIISIHQAHRADPSDIPVYRKTIDRKTEVKGTDE